MNKRGIYLALSDGFSTEIVFLRTSVRPYGTYHLGSFDVKFEILEGNVENAFDIIKRTEQGMYVGESTGNTGNFPSA